MGTRSGDMDPAIISFLADKEGVSADDIISVCNKKSGVLGLSAGFSSDFRDLAEASAEGNEMWLCNFRNAKTKFCLCR